MSTETLAKEGSQDPDMGWFDAQELNGKKIYTFDGDFFGVVENPILSFSSGEVTALVVSNCNPEFFSNHPPQTLRIPFRWVRKVGDILVTLPMHTDSLVVDYERLISLYFTRLRDVPRNSSLRR